MPSRCSQPLDVLHLYFKFMATGRMLSYNVLYLLPLQICVSGLCLHPYTFRDAFCFQSDWLSCHYSTSIFLVNLYVCYLFNLIFTFFIMAWQGLMESKPDMLEACREVFCFFPPDQQHLINIFYTWYTRLYKDNNIVSSVHKKLATLGPSISILPDFVCV